MESAQLAATRQPVQVRSFVGEKNLRGRNFSEQDLAGADFSDADIRGARFVDANLVGAKFVGAEAGVQQRWLVSQLILIFVIIALLNFVAGIFSSFYLLFWFGFSGTTDIIITIAIALAQIFSLCAVARQGLTLKALYTSLAAIAVTAVVTGAVVAAAAVVRGVAAGAGAAAAAAAVVAAAGGGGGGGAAAAGVVAAGAAFAAGASIAAEAAAAAGAAGAAASLVLAFYIASQIKKGNEKFLLARNLGLAFSTLGGTSFAGADLTGADFSGARLKSTNFDRSRQRPTQLKHVCWDNAKQLDKAKLDGSILTDARVQKLLTQRTIYELDPKQQERRPIDLTHADLHDADLNGICFNGICFKQANLHRADLNRATCQDADLSHARLSEVQAIGTNFSRASLTGACIENWAIDETTVLDDLQCDYFFYKYDAARPLDPSKPHDNRFCDRRPHDENKIFQPGDFKKYIRDVHDALQLLIRNSGVLNLGQISGQVSQAINQLPESSEPDQPNLKDLLSQLKTAIETDELSDEDKADALAATQTLAELGQTPDKPEKNSIGRRALKLLKATASSVPSATKFVEACTKLLPLITKALGLP